MPRLFERSVLGHRYARLGWAGSSTASDVNEKKDDNDSGSVRPPRSSAPLLRRDGGLATVRRDRKPCIHVAALAVVIAVVVALFTAAVFVPTLLVCRRAGTGGDGGAVAIAGSQTWAHGAGCPFNFMTGSDRPSAVAAQAVAAVLHVLTVGAVYAGLLGLLVTDPGITATPMHGELACGEGPATDAADTATAATDTANHAAPAADKSGLAAPFSPTAADEGNAADERSVGDDEREPLTTAAPPPPPPPPHERGGISRQGVWVIPAPRHQKKGSHEEAPIEMYRKVCRCCNAVRAPRTAHCARCNVCIAGFDHHCGVTDTCVGAGNIRVFLLFVGGLCALCDWCAVWCSAALYAGHAASRRGVVEASSIGLLFIVLVNTLQLHAGLLLYGRLYVCLGVTLREHRKRGGLYKGRELATEYDGCCGGGCGCGSSDDGGPDDETASVPRPFDRGVLRNTQQLLCGGSCCCAVPCCRCCCDQAAPSRRDEGYRWQSMPSAQAAPVGVASYRWQQTKATVTATARDNVVAE